MKKVFFLGLIILLLSFPAAAGAAEPRVVVDGVEMNFDVPPVMGSGQVLVPLRTVLEALGLEVEWDGESRAVTATGGGKEIKLYLEGGAYVDGRVFNPDPPARLIKGRTLVPAVFIEKALGVKVKWNEKLRAVSIYSPRKELIWAAYNGDEAGVKRLMAGGDDPNVKDGKGWTALNWAAFNGYPGVVKLLLSSGAAAGIRDKAGWNAFMFAVAAGNAEVVKVFLGFGSDSNDRDKDGGTPLFFTSEPEMVKILLAAGADPNAANSRGQTALIWNAAGGKTEVNKMLLDAGANPNKKDKAGITALMLAAMDGNPAMVKMLIGAGADARAINSSGETALDIAVRMGHSEIVTLLTR
ncbi:MAG: ankyrin repeat domain-containing protein [Bacillota bacterium]